MSDLASLEQRTLAELNSCKFFFSSRRRHTRYFGKQGEVLLAVKKIGEVPPAERRAYGQEANRIKEALTKAYEAASEKEKEKALARDLQSDALDVTLPGRPLRRGRLHVATDRKSVV